MSTVIGADAAKLAGLQIDLLQKVRSEQISLDHLEWFNGLTKEERDRFSSGAYAIGESHIVAIDRVQPFNPVKLLGQGWAIDEQDERSLTIAKVDLSKVQLCNVLKKGESSIRGEERLIRLKQTGHVRLDAKVFQTLWEDQKLIPEIWKERINGNIRYIFFDGTILRNPHGHRAVLSLYWHDGRWRWHYYWLGYDWHVSNHPSAVLLASI